MEFHIIVGTIGATLVLIAFVLSSLKKLSRGTYRYMAINGIGAFMLVYYAVASSAVVFAVLNTIWGSVEIYYLIKKLVRK